MTTRVLVLLTLIAAAASQQTPSVNQTELQAAMEDMRGKFYFGFVIMLKLLSSSSNSIPLNNGDITFLVPDDRELSESGIGAEDLHEFVLSHTIPSALAFNSLLRFPSGTLVPSAASGRALTFTNNGRSSLVINNAKVVRPNMCNTTSLMKCHGISAALKF